MAESADVFGSFDEALPQLLSLYDRGLLVPFIGAGMSANACPLWPGFVERLEAEASAPGHIGKAESKEQNASQSELIRRADIAVRKLRRKGFDRLIDAVDRAIYGGSIVGRRARRPMSPPGQTLELAAIYWPLVITTNYDDHYVRAHERADAADVNGGASFVTKIPVEWKRLSIVGRSQRDCHRVLAALHASDSPLLWALQGFLPRHDAPRPDTEALMGELVVGHEAYRRATHREQHFRRTFAEVFRRRSFLFLGSGLGEPYFLDLFNEVLEYFGPNAQPHFACVGADQIASGAVDPEFLRARFNIIVLEYGRHDDLKRWLTHFRTKIDEPRRMPARWGYRFALQLPIEQPGVAAKNGQNAVGVDDLTIVADPLPVPAPGEFVVVSGGPGTGCTNVSPSIKEYLNGLEPGMCTARGWEMAKGYDTLREVSLDSGRRVAIASAWKDERHRDLRRISVAATEAFEWAAEGRATLLRMSLLASGASAPFHPRFSFIEIVRAFAKWRKEAKDKAPLALVIHVVDRPLIFDLLSGRIDVQELLAMTKLRFWTEVVEDGGGFSRELFYRAPDTPISELLESLNLDQSWSLELRPAAVSDRTHSVSDSIGTTMGMSVNGSETLHDLGVLPGSTLRFTRPGPPSAGESAASARDEWQ